MLIFSSEEITIWAVCFQYFLFKTQDPDEDNDCYHLVNLENGNSTLLVEDFLKAPECKVSLGINNNR